MRLFDRFSIRAVLDLVVAAMGVLLIGTSAYTLTTMVSHSNKVNQVADLTATSRDLLRTLLAVRLERGVLSAAVGAEQAIDPSAEADAVKNRGVSEEGYKSILAALDASNLDGMKAAASRLRTTHESIAALRVKVDAAVRQARSDRDPQLADQWGKALVDYMDALSNATDIIDASTKLVDPVLDHLLMIKRSAWATRMSAGGIALPIQTAIASGKPWTAADNIAVSELSGRAAHSWALVEEAAARPDIDASIVAAVTKARINFQGPYFEQRKAIITALQEGRKSPVEIADLRRQDTTNQGYIVDAAHAAVEQMVVRAAQEKGHALLDATIAGLLLVAAIGLSGIGILVAHKRVSGPIRAMTNAMRRLADRDMAVEIPGRDRSDEIGDMAGAVVVFRDSMITADRLAKEQAAEQAAKERRAVAVERLVQHFESTSAEVVRLVLSASTELSRTAESMASLSEQTNEQATASAAAAEEASANVQTVAAAAEEMSASIQEISRQVARANEIASKAGREAHETTGSVQSLSEETNRIGEVVKLIQDIASQTNLLALNATIEAARAGEAGKGFAVVASEVKQLANQTAKATEEISTKIANVQGATKETVEAIERIGGTILNMNEVSSTIAAAIEEQTATTGEITRNVHQAAEGTGMVSRNIVQVNQAANQTGSAASLVLSSANDLARQAEAMRKEVETFLTGIREA